MCWLAITGLHVSRVARFAVVGANCECVLIFEYVVRVWWVLWLCACFVCHHAVRVRRYFLLCVHVLMPLCRCKEHRFARALCRARVVRYSDRCQ